MSRQSLAGLALLLGLAPAAPAATVDAIPAECIAPVFVPPTGITARPADNAVLLQEYGRMTASSHLQGRPATRKLAPGFWEPAYNPNDPATATLMRFHTVVTVVNPNDVPLSVEIRYRDRAGNLLQTNFRSLAAEGQWSEPARPLRMGDGLGSIEVVSTAPTEDIPFVASTMHHTFQVWSIGDPLPSQSGMTSIQQMQIEQADKTTLFWGPMPTTTSAPNAATDLFEGMTGLWWLVNPTAQPNNVLVLLQSRAGIAFNFVVTLPPNGAYLDRTFWDQFLQFYLAPGFPFDDDFRVMALSLDNLPLIGEGLMIDVFGPGLQRGMRFRWGSTLMQNTPAARLVNPEFISAPNASGTNTLMGLMNVDGAGQDIGPVTISYFNRNGVVVASDVLASFPATRMARIGPGLPDSPNYPGGVFSGWVEITSCKPGLAGWSMRVNERVGTAPGQTVEELGKVWGEELDGGNGLEPGPGFAVTRAGMNLIRKVSTLNLVEPDNPATPLVFEQWPGYTTFVNDSVVNLGPHFYRFFTPPGFDISNYAPQPFAGLRARDTSFSYEDGFNFLVTPFGREFTSGRVDHLMGGIRGIHALGGNVQDYPWEEVLPPPPGYNGPGDVVPPQI